MKTNHGPIGAFALCAALAFSLAACTNGDGGGGSGGGGGGGGGTPANLPPVAKAGANQMAIGGAPVTLDGTASSDDHAIVSYAWSQVSGPAITLANGNTSTASFVVPAVAALQNAVFRLTVTDADGATGTDDITVVLGRTLQICLDGSIADATARQKAAQDQALIAFFDAREGDVLQFCEGKFEFTNGLVMTGKRGITIRGAGINKTFLRFKNSGDQDGISINRVTGIDIEDLTVYDAPGNGVRIFRTDFVNMRRVKIGWTLSDPAADDVYGAGTYNSDPATWTANGSYAFYPVLCRKVLIEDSISVGSSDAGVYVGQSSDILVRRTEAYHNVAGFEFENTYRAEFVDNIAHDNVGGFLVFDLPGRAQFGEKNRVHRNHSYSNNVASFAPRGAIVGDVPSGTGMLVLASDQLEVYDNLVEDNNTVGLAIVNYGLIDTNEGDRKYDFYPEGLHIYGNTFRDNGGTPALPDISRDACKGSPVLLPPPFPPIPNPLPTGLPGQQDLPQSTSDLNSVPPAPLDCVTNNATLITAILVLKNGGKSAQIVWDGAEDPGVDAGCLAVPVDRNGVALTTEVPGEQGRFEARHDERMRPNFSIFDPSPNCPGTEHHHYNKWKFDDAGALKKPQNGMCIESNVFEATAPQNMLVSDFANVHFATDDPTVPANLIPADNTPPSDCPTMAPLYVDQSAPILGSFTPNLAADPPPTAEDIAEACDAATGSAPNYNALMKFNCPRLDQYNLFASKTDPRTGPNGFGVPFELNTILFSDYATKYRFVFLPPDPSNASVAQKATYVDRGNCHAPGIDVPTIFDCTTATLQFPLGTVFSKTFSFKNGASEDVVETRLLIKRGTAESPRWVGMAYLWQPSCAETGGTRCARLVVEGATKSVAWNYDDEDPNARDVGGTVRPHYAGSSPNYGIPNAGACLLCHSADDREPGAAPIGPKVRNLKRSTLDLLVNTRHLLDLPAGKAVTDLEQMPKWNVPGSSGAAANSNEDIHKRARAYLEVNCMHCHNSAGYAQNSGLGLDANDALFGGLMGEGHGICKPPIAAGKAAENTYYDIVPGNAGASLLQQRIASETAGIKMPPLARTVHHTEALNLITQWIDSAVTDYVSEDSNTCGDSGGSLPIDLGLPVP